MRSGGFDLQTYIHGVTTSRLFAGVTFSKSPEEGVRQSIFTKIGENFIINLEGGEVGYKCLSV